MSVILPWIICGLGALFYCYEYFLRILPSVMTNDLMLMFNVNAATLGNLVAFYYYAYTPMQFPVGILMDRYGPRRLLVFACFLCALGTYLFSYRYLHIAQFGRFILGLGSAFAFVGVLKLATLWLSPSRFAFIAGLATTLGMLGAMGGNILLAKLVKELGSITVLYISAAIGIVLMFCLWLFIPDHYSNLNKSNEYPVLTYKKLFAEVIALCRNYQTWLIGLMGCLLYLSLSAFAELWGVPYLIQAYGLSNQSAASNISMVFFGWAVGGPLIGWLSDKIQDRRLPLIMGAILGAIVFSIILYVHALCTSFSLPLFLFLFGLFSSAQVLVFPLTFEVNSSLLASTSIAMTNFLVMISGALSQPLIGFFLDLSSKTYDKNSLSAFSSQDFQHVLSIIPIGFLITAILTLFVQDKMKENHLEIKNTQ